MKRWAYASMVFYAIGMPLVFAYILFSNRSAIQADQELRMRGIGNTRTTNPFFHIRQRYQKLYGCVRVVVVVSLHVGASITAHDVDVFPRMIRRFYVPVSLLWRCCVQSVPAEVRVLAARDDRAQACFRHRRHHVQHIPRLPGVVCALADVAYPALPLHRWLPALRDIFSSQSCCVPMLAVVAVALALGVGF
jgi:hypothetical protein